MWKNVKSALHDEFTTVDKHELSHTEDFTVDDDYVLQSGTSKTYHEIYMQYINVKNNFMLAKTQLMTHQVVRKRVNSYAGTGTRILHHNFRFQQELSNQEQFFCVRIKMRSSWWLCCLLYLKTIVSQWNSLLEIHMYWLFKTNNLSNYCQLLLLKTCLVKQHMACKEENVFFYLIIWSSERHEKINPYRTCI